MYSTLPFCSLCLFALISQTQQDLLLRAVSETSECRAEINLSRSKLEQLEQNMASLIDNQKKTESLLVKQQQLQQQQQQQKQKQRVSQDVDCGSADQAMTMVSASSRVASHSVSHKH